MASACLKKPPVFNEEECDYEEWKKDLELWTLLTDLPKNKVGVPGRLLQSYLLMIWSQDGITKLTAKLDKARFCRAGL